MSLTVQVRSKVPTTSIELTGRLVSGQGFEQIREDVRNAIDKGSKQILINMAGVTYIDSCGLGELAGFHASAARKGARLVLLNSIGAVRTSLKITGLDTVIATADSIRRTETGSYVVQ
jgi:anti-sigma B factor antagonist